MSTCGSLAHLTNGLLWVFFGSGGGLDIGCVVVIAPFQGPVFGRAECFRKRKELGGALAGALTR